MSMGGSTTQSMAWPRTRSQPPTRLGCASMSIHDQAVGGSAMPRRRGPVLPLRQGGTVMAFVAAFLAVLAVALIQGAKPFYYDSLNYWMLGETFTVHGSFSLLHF